MATWRVAWKSDAPVSHKPGRVPGPGARARPVGRQNPRDSPMNAETLPSVSFSTSGLSLSLPGRRL